MKFFVIYCNYINVQFRKKINLDIIFWSRYTKILKGYVRNCARPEGCIAECYLADECMQFCSGYMKKAAKIGVRHNRNEEFENESILEGASNFCWETYDDS